MIIKDGLTSDTARVNKFNQLKVLSESVPSEGAQASRGKSFIIHAECETAAAASGALLEIVNHSSDYHLEVTRIYIDAHTLTPTDLVITQTFDATSSNGTDVSSSAIVQKNRSSQEDFDLTIKISDSSSDLTFTGGEQYHAFPVTTMSSQSRNMQLTNILPKNKSIIWGWKTRGGGNATDGEVISLSINVVKRSINGD